MDERKCYHPEPENWIDDPATPPAVDPAEPVTEAGRALLIDGAAAGWSRTDDLGPSALRTRILAIEAEAGFLGYEAGYNEARNAEDAEIAALREALIATLRRDDLCDETEGEHHSDDYITAFLIALDIEQQARAARAVESEAKGDPMLDDTIYEGMTRAAYESEAK
jgi:hypothetical protein